MPFFFPREVGSRFHSYLSLLVCFTPVCSGPRGDELREVFGMFSLTFACLMGAMQASCSDCLRPDC